MRGPDEIAGAADGADIDASRDLGVDLAGPLGSRWIAIPTSTG